ncbi:MAG TPA: transglutaminase-like domain-containing protein [Candidatus Krumholzibacteria bacterium]|nr:transglutaminase-like domain-containing protein [Candidatus Krumholzibacteria bacterium]
MAYRSLIRLLGIGVMVWSVGAAAAPPVGPPPEDEQWFVVRMGGSAVGTASERWTHGETETVFQAQMNLSFTRLGTPLSMSVLTEETCTPEGGFVRARMQSSVSNLSAVATLDGDSLRYETSTGGETRREAMAWSPEAVTEKVARERTSKWLDGTAPELTLTLFDISDGGYRAERLVRGKTIQAAIGKTERDVIPVEEYDDGASTVSSTTWYDAGGEHEPLRTLVRQLGVEIEIVRVTTAELEATRIKPSFDIIKQSMVPCPGFPVPATRMETITLVLDFPGALPPKSMTGPSQRELQRSDRSVTLQLTRTLADRETLPPDRRDVFLEPDRFVQSDAPELKTIADSLRTATRSDPWVLARAVAAWADAHITHKGMEHGYSSALEVYRSRAGDCTEHSLLTTAVLRAAGIPARPVVGLAYSEHDHAFVGHMWVEAYVDEWRTLDALNLGLDPIRIRVYAPESNEELGERDLMRAYAVMAGVKVRAVDSEARD